MLKHAATSFESCYLVVLTFLEVFSICDQIGWSVVGFVNFVSMFVAQANAIYLDALHYRFPDFDNKWKALMKYRDYLDAEGRNATSFQDPMSSDVEQPPQEGISEANFSVEELDETTSHVIAEVFRHMIRVKSEWGFLTKLKWRVKIVHLFSRKDILFANFIGFIATVAVYFVFSTGTAFIVSNRKIDILWFNWTMQDIFRSVTFTGALFYSKRLFLMLLSPFYVSSIVSSQLVIPLVPELSYFMNPGQKQTFERFARFLTCNQNPHEIHPSENDGLPSLSEVSLPPNTQESPNEYRVQNERRRDPVYLMSSSGRGQIIDIQRYVIHNIFNPGIVSVFRKYCMKYMHYLFLSFLFIFPFYYYFLMTAQTWTATAGFALSIVSGLTICLQFLSNIPHLTILCLSSFETLYLAGNLLIAFISGSSYFPDYHGYGSFTLFVLSSVVFSCLFLDAMPISVKNFRNCLDKANTIQSHEVGAGSFSIIDKIIIQISDRMALFPTKAVVQVGRSNRISLASSSLRNLGRYMQQIGLNQQKLEPIAFHGRIFNKLRKYHTIVSMFVVQRTISMMVGMLCVLSMYVLVETGWVHDASIVYFHIGAGVWANEPILKSAVFSLCVFLFKRVVVKVIHPERCVTIYRPMLRVPLSPAVRSLVAKELAKIHR
eukprot:TRINITY_DN12304_c0_g2_i1.p1 TRINITY_DN12304_c0_g2~~TRINITY_DN12304_c0_g2_i1.p1  ORF type:complete len:761 (+),score=128.33 TRINITY_DN12304_c0_g2_i1:307-2283(+)